MRMRGYCDVYKWTILKRTSPEVKCLHLTSSRREMCTLSVSNVIYHTFSHGAAFYTLNGKNVNVMLEFYIMGKALSGKLSCTWTGLILSAGHRRSKNVQKFIVCTLSDEGMNGFEPNLHRYILGRSKRTD